jgi:pimeloyl-ACP methyl ester carboxylesterase
MKKIIFGMFILSFLISCQKEEISSGNDVHDNFFLEEKGNAMPIQVHGNLASNKMLFVVHGGPGGNAITYRDDYVIKNVESQFAVIYWDQRLAGASQGNSSDDDIALFKADAKKVIQLIKSRYGNDKELYIFGHSWGGFLSPYFLQDGNNQDLFKGWIQIDGAHDYYKNDSLTREMLLAYGKREIAKNKNTDKWQPILDYCNLHPYDESFEVAVQLNRYAGQAEGYIDEVNEPVNTAFGLLTSNDFSATAQISNIINTAMIRKIDRQTYPIPTGKDLYKLKLPTLLLWGRHDFVCPIGLTDDIKKNIGSNDVTEKVFENSGHSPMNNEPELFWKTVVDWVKVH